MEESKSVWGFSCYKDPDQWSGGEDTKEAAIKEAHATYGINSTVYVVEGEQPVDGYRFLPSVDDIMETTGQRAYDQVGEISEDWPDIGKAGEEALEKLLRDWAKEYLPVTFWVQKGDPERVDPLILGAWICAKCDPPEGYVKKGDYKDDVKCSSCNLVRSCCPMSTGK